ncbi:MAG: hypothetical protein LBP71_02005, partial [Spirochaetaceae bacterium]|nr:hypothetical protein [Spirochaetaceae bacterium]
ADFSYPRGITYARGTYIYPYFDKRQNRFSPTESLFSDFLYRNPSLTQAGTGDSWYYETKIMSRYREGLEAKAHALGTVRAVPGMGPPLALEKKYHTPPSAAGLLHLFSSGPLTMSAQDFLVEYQKKICSLPSCRQGIPQFLEKLKEDERLILTTLLPIGAALKYRRPELRGEAVLEEVQAFCKAEISRILPGMAG